MQIGDRIYRVGGAYVSFYVIEDGGRLTVVDAGLPGYWDDLDRLIGQNGWSLIDVSEERSALFAGDALVTVDIITGRPGPRIPPRTVNAASDRALESLGRLDGIEADVLLVDHGEPWTGGVPAAVAGARTVGIT